MHSTKLSEITTSTGKQDKELKKNDPEEKKSNSLLPPYHWILKQWVPAELVEMDSTKMEHNKKLHDTTNIA